MKEQELKQTTMRRIYMVHTCRKFWKSCASKLFIFGAFAFYATSMVSVANVFANMPGIDRPAAVLQFYFQAFVHAYPMVQASVVLMGVLGILIARDIAYTARAAKFAPVVSR